jgi:ribosomal protein S18 acetylase RimI-like enzyme
MPSHEFRELTSDAELKEAYTVLRHLRIGLTPDEFRSLYADAHKQSGYTILGLMEKGRCVAVMGFRLLADFVHGRHLYVDDLVVLPELRSKGLGAACLAHAERIARERGLDSIRLCTGVDNEAGRRFYEREHYTAKAVAYKKRVEAQ